MNTTSKWILTGILIVCLVVAFFPRTLEGKATKVYWKSYVEVEHFVQVRVTDSRSRPPSDAYDTAKHQECTSYTSYNPTTKQINTTTSCHWEYSWTMDRWRVAYRSENSGTDRQPTYNIPSLVHVETGYGNQRHGKQYVNYFVSADFGKTCPVSESLWRKTEVGSRVRTTRLGFVVTICNMR